MTSASLKLPPRAGVGEGSGKRPGPQGPPQGVPEYERGEIGAVNGGEDSLRRLNELIAALKEGRAKAEECIDEIRELAGERFAPLAALVAGDNIHDRYEAGEISASQAMSMAREHADAYPAVPILFMYCSYYAHELGDDLDSLGYLALYRLKSMHIEEFSDFGRDQEWEEIMRPLFDKLEEDGEPLCVWPFFEEGGRHLVNHFLVQEITAGVLDPHPEWAEIILERFDELTPLLLNMLEDQLRLASVTSCDAPAGLHTLIGLVGCLESLEALPALLAALAVCVVDPLNEALLALARLGSKYPEEVSRELRGIAGEAEWGDVRLAAVDALGILGEAPGNLDFLLGMLAGWRPDAEGENHLFRFLVHALLSTREEAAAQAVASSLQAHLAELDDDSVSFAEDYLENYRHIFLGPRLPDLLAEGPGDFLRCSPSDLARERRCTMTLQREDDLEKAEVEKALALDLETVEMLLRRGRNEPCSCGSGLKFKKCCLPRLEEMRNRLRRGEEVAAEKTPYELVMEDLERYAALPSVRAERGDAMEEFLSARERTWFKGGAGLGGVSEKDAFEDWFLLSRPLDKSGLTVAQEMLKIRGEAFEPPELSLLRGLASSRYSVYEVREAVPGEEVLLRDIFRGGEVRVRERTASRQVVKWDLLSTRVGEVGDHHQLMGASFVIPRNYLEPLETFVRRTSEEMIAKESVKDLDDFLQQEGHLIYHQVMLLFENEPRPVSVTAEGDEFAWCTAVFDVADAEEARRLLSSHPYIKDEGMKAGARRFSWFLSREMEDELRRGEHVGPQNKSRTFSASPKGMTEKQVRTEKKRGNVMRGLGSLELRGKRLVFETQSLPRLEAGKRELEALLEEVATHRADSIQDQEALLGEAWRERGGARGRKPPAAVGRGPDIPPEVAQEIFKETMERAYGNWLDEPIPYLGGKTPRQAAKTAKGRELVNRLLQEYENRAERDKKEGRPAYDFSRFRRELDIWPE